MSADQTNANDKPQGLMLLTAPTEVDASIEALLTQAWERS